MYFACWAELELCPGAVGTLTGGAGVEDEHAADVFKACPVRMAEHDYLRTAALGGVQQRIEPAAADGVAVAVRQKRLHAAEINDLVLGVTAVIIAVAGHGTHGYLGKFTPQALCVTHTVAEVDDLIGAIFPHGIYHALRQTVGVGKNGNFHCKPPQCR